MQTFFFELKTECNSCGNPLLINAFAREITCEHCNQKNEITSKLWKSLVVESMHDASNYQEGQRSNSKMITGGYEFSVGFGKRKAQCPKCKTVIPDNVFDSFETGEYKCAQCENEIYIRKPDEFAQQIVPSAKYIVGEDVNQIKTGIQGMQKPEAIKPIIFTCPACAANLEVDGSKRVIICKYCNASVYLPDDLWYELHPAKIVERWYIVNNEGTKTENGVVVEEKIPEWYYLSDVAIDNEGNVYVASEEDSGDSDFIVWSFNPELKTRWIRKGIKLDHENTGMVITRNGKLLLWNKFKRSLIMLSCKDGTDLLTLKGEDPSDSNPYPFTMKGCDALLSDSDNTILAVINNTFVRFYDDGTRAPVWTAVSEKHELPGLFSRMFGGGNTTVKIPNDDEWAPCVKEIGSQPKRVSGEYTKMNLGYDGYVYMYDTSSTDSKIAKYTREGNQVWKRDLPLSNKECKPYADANGFVYVIGSEDDNKTKLIRMSPDGKDIEVLQKDVLDGGLLSVDDRLAVSKEGRIYTFRFYNVLKVFNPDLTCVFESDQSKEEGLEKMRDYKKQKEAEE